jgi:hypothetical protein
MTAGQLAGAPQRASTNTARDPAACIDATALGTVPNWAALTGAEQAATPTQQDAVAAADAAAVDHAAGGAHTA